MDQPEIAAARARLVEERRQQAQRRALLTVTLLVITLAMIPVVGLTSLSAWWMLVPAVPCVAVLILGRRAVVLQERADAELARRARMAYRAELASRMTAGRPGVRRVGRPVPVAQPRTQGVHAGDEAAIRGESVVRHEPERAVVEHDGAVRDPSIGWSASVEEMLDRVDERRGLKSKRATGEIAAVNADSAAKTVKDASAGRADYPQRVPRPVYATKPAAPRWEPAPLSAEIERATRAMADWEAENGTTAGQDTASGQGEHDVIGVVEDERFAQAQAQALAQVQDQVQDQGSGALGADGLYGVLERRRAVGE